jgi:hypothetical protein
MKNHNHRVVLILAVALGVAAVVVPAYAEAGLSEIETKTAFWVIPPFALEKVDGKDNSVTLFAGHEARWYDLWAFTDIEQVGWLDWDVKNINCYGASASHGIIFGVTNDRRWFVAYTSGGSLPRYYDDEASWRKELARYDVGPEGMLTFEQGYRASQRSLWAWRICKVLVVVGVFSLGWFAARWRYKKALSSKTGS